MVASRFSVFRKFSLPMACASIGSAVVGCSLLHDDSSFSPAPKYVFENKDMPKGAPIKQQKEVSSMNPADKANYDESKVPSHEVPSALARPDGSMVSTAFEWSNSQRDHILRLFQEHMYGTPPPRPDELRFELLSRRDDALGGAAVRKEIRVHSRMADGRSHHFDVILYAPKAAKKPVPVFVGLNFYGNHAITSEPDVRMAVRPAVMGGEGKERGWNAEAWQVEKIVGRGYALATAYYCEIYPDGYSDKCREESIYPKLFSLDKPSRPGDFVGGAISAWVWGLSRVLDYLETEPLVDASKAAVMGHSRLGKTSLWAGASDKRFAMVISNNSGCCGAAISRRRFGETFELINGPVSYWFTPSFKNYSNREDDIPVEQNMLIALAAPRPVYVTSATEDLWADPKGEFLSTSLASEVYSLFGSKGLGATQMPPPDSPVMGDLAYHIRTGKHKVAEYDWERFMDFADKHFRR